MSDGKRGLWFERVRDGRWAGFVDGRDGMAQFARLAPYAARRVATVERHGGRWVWWLDDETDAGFAASLEEAEESVRLSLGEEGIGK